MRNVQVTTAATLAALCNHVGAHVATIDGTVGEVVHVEADGWTVWTLWAGWERPTKRDTRVYPLTPA